jgi:hypothetical protein
MYRFAYRMRTTLLTQRSYLPCVRCFRLRPPNLKLQGRSGTEKSASSSQAGSGLQAYDQALDEVAERAMLSDCGLPGALSLMLTAAVRLPVEEGLQVTVMLQLPPAGTDVPQLFVSAKFLGLAPVTLTDVIVSLPLPVYRWPSGR